MVSELSIASTPSRRSSGRHARQSRRVSLNHKAKHFVQHDYHDHYHDQVRSDLQNFDLDSKQRRGHRGGVAVPFPERLHEMLSAVDKEGLDDIVSWQGHGRCFIVRKPKEFVEEVMPRFFKQSKLTSFQRQLNLYGFSRLTAGPDRGGYYHELFLRGRIDLCKDMVRTRVKGNGSKAAASPSTEPNFYTMEPCLETDTSLENVASTARFVVGTPKIHRDNVVSDSEDSVRQGSEGHASHRRRSESVGSTFDANPNSSLPIVSPVSNMRQKDVVVHDLPSMPLAPPLGLPIPSKISFASLPSSFEGDASQVHSGDTLFFEGLPFHYLDSNDFGGDVYVV